MADRVTLGAKFIEQFPGRFAGLGEPWEQSSWSKIYKVEFFDRKALILKGTPRNRPEALTTSVLHHHCPNHIPAVLNDDFVPEDSWRWFLLENAGECNHETIAPKDAVNAAHGLGKLQSIVCQEPVLAQSLPQCRADCLQEAVIDVCEWALQTVPADLRNSLLSFQAKLGHSTNFFHALQKELAPLPSTCVHGDFWSGNIAFREDEVSFIDWGDALWGVGSISIVNLLDTNDGALSSHANEIWGAYARGWGRAVPESFIHGSRIAELVGFLVVDVEIAKCCGGTVEMMPGLFPGLQRLVDLIA